MKEPTQRAIDAASNIYIEAYEESRYVGDDFCESTFDSLSAANIIQAAIDEAVREALEKASARTVAWYRSGQLIPAHLESFSIKTLRAAILGEAVNQ